VHLAYIWIVSYLSAKNYRNLWKFDEVLTKTNLLSFFWDTVYKTILHFYAIIIMDLIEQTPKQTSHAKQCERWSRISC